MYLYCYLYFVINKTSIDIYIKIEFNDTELKKLNDVKLTQIFELWTAHYISGLGLHYYFMYQKCK